MVVEGTLVEKVLVVVAGKQVVGRKKKYPVEIEWGIVVDTDTVDPFH